MAMLNRQRLLLYLLELLGGTASRLQFVKLCFLVREESWSGGGDSFFGFVPYKRGPYSFGLYHEIDFLIRNGYIVELDEKNWQLKSQNSSTIESLPPSLKDDAEVTVSNYGALPLRQLIDYVYGSYPWFTINSTSRNKRRLERPLANPAVYTIGYEALNVDDFLNRLLRNGLECLVDVRNNPVARRYGFHKSTLKRLCGYMGMEYLHYPSLGIPSSERKNLNSPHDYHELFRHYNESTLRRESHQIQTLGDLLKEKASALLCSEANPEFCHRSHLAKKISELTGLGICHLEWPR